jgi:ribonuclease HI
MTTFYTDGSCMGNGKGLLAQAGYAIVFDSKVIYGKVKPLLGKQIVHPSSIRAEGIAIIRALELCKKGDTIVSDSEFWINMLCKFMPSWSTDKFNEKKNSDLTKKMYKLYLKKQPKMIHVNSHGKNPNQPAEHTKYNDVADKYANLGRELKKYKEETATI